jgi:glycogen debranching enzyme
MSLDSDNKLHLLFRDMELADFNYLLFRCDAEERHESFSFGFVFHFALSDFLCPSRRASTEGKRGAYAIPNFGTLVYAGLQGWVSVLDKIRAANDMGHPMLDNLRQGNWQLDFVVERLRDVRQLDGVREWLNKYFTLVKKLPRHLVPKYFDKVHKHILCGWSSTLALFILECRLS